MKVVNRKTPPKPKGGAKRANAIKAKTKEKFLRWYEKGGAIYWAATKAGVSHDTIDRWRKEDPDFDNAVIDAYAKSTDTLKITAFTRAINGSDNLTMFLIKQRDPSFREHFGVQASHLHAGAIATTNKVPVSVQAAVDALSLEIVKKMAEKL